MESGGQVYAIAIVGGGQAAKALLMVLAERAISHGAARTHTRVAIFERGQEIGPGFAWSTTHNLPEHLASQPGGASRAQYGREQVHVVERLVAMLVELDVQVDLFRNVEIVDLKRAADRWILVGQNSTWAADAVVLATGHWRDAPAELAEVPHEYPWPATRLQEAVVRLPPGSNIAVLGSYHTAIDAALTIALACGRFEPHSNRLRYVARRAFKAGLLSRSGRLPLVWPDLVQKFELTGLRQLLARVSALGNAGELHLEELLCAVRSELREGEDACNAARAAPELMRLLATLYLPDGLATLERCLQPRNWSPRNLRRMGVMAALLPLVSELFPYLDAGSYRRFEHHYRSAFFNVAMPMPRITAERLCALMAAGVLTVEAIGQHSWRIVSGKPTLFYHHASAASTGRSYDLLVNGRASGGVIAHHPGRLMQSLQAKRMITGASRECPATDDAAGEESVPVPGLKVDRQTCEVVPGSGAATRNGCRLYSMGPNNEGTFLDAQSIGQLARDAVRIVSHLDIQRAG